MDSNQPTAGVKRKIPGPASKTLKKRNCNLEAPTCNTKTKCLFCFNPIIIPFPIKTETEKDRKRIQHLKNLCHHFMKTNQDELPTDYSPEAFPFCAPCQVNVDQLWEYDEIVRISQIKIAETIQTIEKAVVDGEVVNSSLRMSTQSAAVTAANEKLFMKLRDVIFTGYRNNLLMKQKLTQKLLESSEKRHNFTQQQVTASNNREHGHDKIPDVTPIRRELVEIRGCGTQHEQELSSAPCITLFTSDGETENVPIKRNEDTSAESQGKGDSHEAPIDDITPDVTHTTSAVIDNSSEMDTGSSDCGSTKLTTLHERFVPQSIDKGCRVLEGVIMDGIIEIHWTSGSSPDEAYLNCSMCSHDIKFLTRKAEGLSHASRMMGAHIKKMHQDEKNLIYSTTKEFPVVYSCGACGVAFADTLAQDKHEVVHRTCEICGKMIGRKGNYNSHNMLLHANTHKSESEKKAGAEAGEKGYAVKKRRKSGKHDKNYTF
ncbi:unnamed protein product [Orchesella dallaii]|uniref:C2H2-type domain-containing protein n=1 Tax=Orchesella dallaii TaxID=48710 RepID=A0ABP1QJG4_9HEXA